MNYEPHTNAVKLGLKYALAVDAVEIAHVIREFEAQHMVQTVCKGDIIKWLGERTGYPPLNLDGNLAPWRFLWYFADAESMLQFKLQHL